MSTESSEPDRNDYSSEKPGTSFVFLPSSAIAVTAAKFADFHRRTLALGLPYNPERSLNQNFKTIPLAQRNDIVAAMQNESIGKPLEEIFPLEDVMSEYRAIERAIVQAMGTSAIQLIDYSKRRSSSLSVSMTSLDDRLALFAEEVDTTFPSHRPTILSKLKGYPRDYYTQFGKWLFCETDPHQAELLRKKVYKVESATLSEGGAVLYAGKAIIVSGYVWKTTPHFYFDRLREEGYQIARVPKVKPEGQSSGKKEYAHSHIDGHAALIENPRTHQLTFLYAKSYAEQDETTRSDLQEAARTVGAIPLEIDDSELPHLAFNFPQFPNGKIVCPRGGKFMGGVYKKSSLEIELERIVGSENVILTDTPITYFPKYTQAGIRCLTNNGNSEILAILTQSQDW